jgi:hypothetical protein
MVETSCGFLLRSSLDSWSNVEWTSSAIEPHGEMHRAALFSYERQTPKLGSGRLLSCTARHSEPVTSALLLHFFYQQLWGRRIVELLER